MAYNDPQFGVPYVVCVDNVTSTLTATASGHVVTNTNAQVLPKMLRKSQIRGIQAAVQTAPIAAGVTLILMNGTETAASVAISTNTIGSAVEGVVGASPVFADNVQPTLKLVGTGTASAAQVAGVYDVYLELQEAYE